MSNLISQIELDGIRADFLELIGDITATSTADTPGTTVTVRRSNNDGTTDLATGKVTGETFATIASAVAAHVAPIPFRRDRTEEAGGDPVRIRQYRATLLWDVGDILIGDQVDMITSTDPHLVGRTMEVTDVFYESQLAARRITLTDFTDDEAGPC